jgi:hypothetical protein
VPHRAPDAAIATPVAIIAISILLAAALLGAAIRATTMLSTTVLTTTECIPIYGAAQLSLKGERFVNGGPV